eukprot:3693533-Pyramimonas_sp.AAC.1
MQHDLAKPCPPANSAIEQLAQCPGLTWADIAIDALRHMHLHIGKRRDVIHRRSRLLHGGAFQRRRVWDGLLLVLEGLL